MLAEGTLLRFDPINRDRPDRVSEPVGNHGTDRKSIPRIYRKIRDNNRGIPELISRVYLEGEYSALNCQREDKIASRLFRGMMAVPVNPSWLEQ
jgi:hypothetical protein